MVYFLQLSIVRVWLNPLCFILHSAVSNWLKYDEVEGHVIANENHIYSFVLSHKSNKIHIIDFAYTFPKYRKMGLATSLCDFLFERRKWTVSNKETIKMYGKLNIAKS